MLLLACLVLGVVIVLAAYYTVAAIFKIVILISVLVSWLIPERLGQGIGFVLRTFTLLVLQLLAYVILIPFLDWGAMEDLAQSRQQVV